MWTTAGPARTTPLLRCCNDQFVELVSLISGLMSGLGVAFTVEWNEHFEAARNVPLWETILVASVSCTVAMWVTFFTLNTIHKIRSKE